MVRTPKQGVQTDKSSLSGARCIRRVWGSGVFWVLEKDRHRIMAAGLSAPWGIGLAPAGFLSTWLFDVLVVMSWTSPSISQIASSPP